MELNRAICQTRFGAVEPAEMLELLHRPKPRVVPGRVLVKLTARPIQPFEFLLIRVSHFVHHPRPATMGSEGAGVVEEVGEGVTKIKPGDRVAIWMFHEYMVTGEGSWQEYVSVAEESVFQVPESFSDEDASQMLANPVTVYVLLDDLSVPKGEYLLQTAAASVLGRQMIQLAKHQGIKTINIVRRSAVKEELYALGADEVIDSSTEDVVARVKDITGGKLAYAAIDAVGGTLTKSVTESTRDGGSVFIYGSLSATGEVTVGLEDLRRNVQVRFWSILSHVDCSIPERSERWFAEVIKLQLQKIITIPAASKSYPLLEFKKALQEAQTASGAAKIILV